MVATDIPSRPEISLLVLGYVTVAQAQYLPDGLSLVGYVLGFLLLVLIPLLALDDPDSTSLANRTK